MDFTIYISKDGSEWEAIVNEERYPMPTVNTHVYEFEKKFDARYVRIIGNRLRVNPHDKNSYKMQFAEIEIVENY